MNAQARSEPMRGPELETLLELGEGGMATAYLARSLGPGGFERLVVVKHLIVSLRETEEAIERFVTEARVAAQLHHANIVGTQRIDWDESGPFIVLDYIEGGTLDELVETSVHHGDRLPVPVVLRLALDALHGLCFVHEARDGSGKPLEILHRDISLQNVLVGVHDGIARLADFGVAKSTFSVARTDPGCFVGKLLYFPPEYLLGEPVGPTLDIYALGVTIWLALTGTALWPGAEEGQLARAIVSEGVPDIGEHVAIAPEVRAFVAKACARDPRERYQTAREMASALEHFDRNYGWVASHAEVARVVDRLLGDSLRQRREKIARLVPGLAAQDTEQKLALSLRRTEPAPHPHVAKPARPRRRLPATRRWAPVAIGAAALTALGAALLAEGSGEEAPGPATVISSLPDARPGVTLEPSPPVPAAAPSAFLADSEPPASATAPASGVAGAPPPIVNRSPPPARPRAQPRPASREQPEPSVAPDAGIRRKNPYR
jgi:serine/threonine protein kinase